MVESESGFPSRLSQLKSGFKVARRREYLRLLNTRDAVGRSRLRGLRRHACNCDTAYRGKSYVGSAVLSATAFFCHCHSRCFDGSRSAPRTTCLRWNSSRRNSLGRTGGSSGRCWCNAGHTKSLATTSVANRERIAKPYGK